MKDSLRALHEEQIDRFKDRLKEAIGSESARSFSKRCDISESVIRKYLNGSYPVMDKLPRIAEATKRSIEWLITGYIPTEEEALKDFELVPGYNVHVSAGHGSCSVNEAEPVRQLAFRKQWLERRGIKKEQLVIVWAKGDSMEPTIHNNDTLAVHTGKTIPENGNLYIFRNGEELFVKRYQSMLGSWRLISDNKMYAPLDIPKEDQHQFEVVGQVVHISKDVGV